MAHAVARSIPATARPVHTGLDRLFDLRPGALAGLYAVVSYLVLGALTMSALVLASNAIYSQVDQRLATAATASAEYVGERLLSRSGALMVVASQPDLVAVLEPGVLDAKGTELVQAEMAQLLAATEQGYSAFAAWPDGTLIWSTAAPANSGKNYSNLDWYQGLKKTQGVYVSAAYQAPIPGLPYLVAEVVRALDPSGRFIAIVGVTVELSRIKGYADSFAATQGISLLVADQTGTAVAQSGAVTGFLVKSKQSGVTAALKGRAGNDDSSAQVLSAFAPVPSVRWAVVAQVPRATALSELGVFQRSVLGTAALLALVNAGKLLLLSGALRRRVRSEMKLQQASQYSRNLLEASLDPLVTISPQGKVTDVNEATVNVTGVERSRLIGTDFSAYFTEPDLARAGYQRVFTEGQVTDYPLTIRARDGHVTSVLYNAAVYRDADGEVAGIFAAARDVTAQKRAEAEIRELNRTLEMRVKQRTAELEASNRELEAFTYSVSHDLRAPLRAMTGFANLLNQRQASLLSEEGRQYLERIDANATKMGTLIDELLKFSRLGRSAMQIGFVDMTAAATAAVGDLREEALAGGVQVTVSPLPPARGDPALIQQLFANLVANGIKFSRGRPGARVEIGSHVENGQTVYFVRDNGVGFDMRYADKLFGVFQRLHNQAQYEGTGVGLALVQRIIHRHGGRVWAEAEPDQGATFHFTLRGD